MPLRLKTPFDLHERRGLRRGVIPLFVVVAMAFLSYVGWVAHADLAREKRAAREKVSIGAVALEEHASRAFGEVELLLKRFTRDCDRGAGSMELAQRVENAVEALPQLAFLALYRADGSAIVKSPEAPAPGAAYGGFDPAHFSMAADNGKRSYIGHAFRSPDGTELIPVSARGLDEQGECCAVAIAGVDTDYFEGFFRSFLGSEHGVALLRREQGGIITRVPPSPAPVPKGPRPPEPGSFGVQRVTSPIDGAVRIAAYRKSSEFPLVVRFALTEQALFDDWAVRTLRTAMPGLGILLLLLGAALWIDRLLQRANEREKALTTVNRDLLQARYDAEEANAAKSRFLANMSHEIRTPLNAVVGIGELLQGMALGEPQRGYVEKLKLASTSVLALIDAVLDLSKAEAGRLELECVAFDLPQLLGEVTQLAAFSAERKGVTVRVTIDDRIPRRLLGDPTRLRQLLINLIGNAVKFTDVGEVEISAELMTDDAEQVSIRLAVRDTGVGMTEAQLQRAFDLFTQADASTTRRFGGTGLGLAISQHIAEIMGSRIEASSDPGEGSRFWLDVSFPRAADAETAPAVLPARNALAGIKMLLVDDDLLGREIEKDLLERSGADVQLADTGAEALERCTGGERFDILLMDVQTPEMDGLEATRRLRRGAGADVPIIGLSANALDQEAQRAIDAGMDDYLTKPVDIHRLIAAIKRHLERTNSHDGNHSL